MNKTKKSASRDLVDAVVFVPVSNRRREHGPDACVHIGPHPTQDGLTLCNMTFEESYQKLHTTNLPVDCQECLSILEFCRSFGAR